MSPPSAAPQRGELQPGEPAERALRLAPLIEAAAPRIERDGVLPAELLAALHEAGLFRLLLPRSLGGAEIDLPDFVATTEALARADASTAWCIGQASGCTMAAAYLAPEIARTIFGPADAVLAWGPNSRAAKAIAVEGGYRLSGTWNYASGSRHAQWLGGHTPIFNPDGTPRLGADGKQLDRTMLFPKKEAQVKDVWQVMGLKGTGSDSYTIEDLFVPEAFSFTREAAADRRESGPLYRFSIYNIYAVGFAGVALGIARAMLDAFVALARDKIPAAATKPLRENGLIQAQVGVAEARLRAAKVNLLQTLRDLWPKVAAGSAPSLDDRVSIRLAATFAIHQAKEVAEVIYHAAGASAIFESNPFERRFRDIHAVTQQIQGHYTNFEVAGQVLLGLPVVSRVI